MTRVPSLRCQFFPRFETLEDRTLLSACHVTRRSDIGAGNDFRGDLRYCINKVNTEPGPDVIDFSLSGRIRLSSVLPNLASDIDINGPGADLLAISAEQKARVFYVEPSASVTISGLTLTGGRAQKFGSGGGIFNSGNLTLHDCSVTGNTAWKYGGGVHNKGRLTISNSVVMTNTTRSKGGDDYRTWGAGIYNDFGARLIVSGSVIKGNRISPSLSFIALGGGIANRGMAVIMTSTISENWANPTNAHTIGGNGGGIFNGGQMLVRDSLISNNIAAGDFWAFGGGISNGLRSPYDGNDASYNVPGGKVTVVNSTITGNLAFGRGDLNLGKSLGGGLDTQNGGTMSVRNSTIAGNQSLALLGYVTGHGGGVSNTNSVLDLFTTIVSGNDAKTAGDDVSGVLASSGFNLIEHSAGGSGYNPTDILDVDPLVSPLADNGGPTQTMALLPGSPALDAGDNTDAPEFDQRGPGFPRIVNGTIDIGAFEVQATGAPSTNLAVLLTADFSRFPFKARDLD